MTRVHVQMVMEYQAAHGCRLSEAVYAVGRFSSPSAFIRARKSLLRSGVELGLSESQRLALDIQSFLHRARREQYTDTGMALELLSRAIAKLKVAA